MNAQFEMWKDLAVTTVTGHGAFGEPESQMLLDVDKLIELVIKDCADAADAAYAARCKYPGDYIAEQFGRGTEEGAAAWRMAE